MTWYQNGTLEIRKQAKYTYSAHKVLLIEIGKVILA